MSYAAILSNIKKDDALKEVASCVQKVHRLNAGDLLIVVNKDCSDKEPVLRTAIEKILEKGATIQSKVQEVHLKIKDLDEIITKHVVEAPQR